MSSQDTAAELRRIEAEIALGVARDGRQLLRVVLQLGDGLVMDLVPTEADDEPDHLWRWKRRAS